MKFKKKMPITGAGTQMKPSRTPSNQNYQSQGQAMVKQSPEPFRNPQDIANMAAPAGPKGATTQKTSGISGAKPSLNAGAVGIKNGSGMGSNNGHVLGPNVAKKAGPADFPPVKNNPAPSFYGGSSIGASKGTMKDNDDRKPKAGLAKSAAPHLPQTGAVSTPLNAPGAGKHAGKVVGARFYGR